jgi:hypothetical protein
MEPQIDDATPTVETAETESFENDDERAKLAETAARATTELERFESEYAERKSQQPESFDAGTQEKHELTGEPTEEPIFTWHRKPDAIDGLYEKYLSGENVSYNFNGDVMTSAEIGALGIDGAYEKYFGYDRESYHAREKLERAAQHANYELKQFETEHAAKQEIPKLLESAKDLLKPETTTEFQECLEIRATALYHGMDSKAAIDLMKTHAGGASEEDIKKLLSEQDHSGASYDMVRAIIKHFYKDGDALAAIL